MPTMRTHVSKTALMTLNIRDRRHYAACGVLSIAHAGKIPPRRVETTSPQHFHPAAPGFVKRLHSRLLLRLEAAGL
jgi:hypothetical protein